MAVIVGFEAQLGASWEQASQTPAGAHGHPAVFSHSRNERVCRTQGGSSEVLGDVH